MISTNQIAYFKRIAVFLKMMKVDRLLLFRFTSACSLLRSKGQSFQNTFSGVKLMIGLVNIIGTEHESNRSLTFIRLDLSKFSFSRSKTTVRFLFSIQLSKFTPDLSLGLFSKVNGMNQYCLCAFRDKAYITWKINVFIIYLRRVFPI